MDLTEGTKILAGPFGRAAMLSLKSRLTAHAHAQTHLIVKLDGPDQEFVVAGKTVPLTKDRAVVVNPWQEHHYSPIRTDASTSYLALYLNPRWLCQCNNVFEGCDWPGFFTRPSVRVDEQARKMVRALCYSIRAMDTQTKDPADLIVALMAHFVVTEGAGRTAAQGFVDYRVRRAVAIMLDTYHAQYDLDALARNVGLSRSRFNVLFKEEDHCNRSIDLLAAPDQSISASVNAGQTDTSNRMTIEAARNGASGFMILIGLQSETCAAT